MGLNLLTDFEKDELSMSSYIKLYNFEIKKEESPFPRVLIKVTSEVLQISLLSMPCLKMARDGE